MREMIAESGPISLERYMALALGHPVHGYYRTRIGVRRRGDFITAPEISQMFGELIGLWCVEVWRLMGGPPPLRLVELGPGRGTLMARRLCAPRKSRRIFSPRSNSISSRSATVARAPARGA